MILHSVKASPTKFSKHVQIGVWFFTIHWALIPHDPGQGFIHLLWIHAKLLEQSALMTHSGLQLGGEPK